MKVNFWGALLILFSSASFAADDFCVQSEMALHKLDRVNAEKMCNAGFCVRNQVHTFNSSFDEAVKICDDSCIQGEVNVFGINYDAAKKLCAADFCVRNQVHSYNSSFEEAVTTCKILPCAVPRMLMYKETLEQATRACQ